MKKRSKLSGLISALMILTLLLSACGNSSSSSQSGGSTKPPHLGIIPVRLFCCMRKAAVSKLLAGSSRDTFLSNNPFP